MEIMCIMEYTIKLKIGLEVSTMLKKIAQHIYSITLLNIGNWIIDVKMVHMIGMKVVIRKQMMTSFLKLRVTYHGAMGIFLPLQLAHLLSRLKLQVSMMISTMASITEWKIGMELHTLHYRTAHNICTTIIMDIGK